MNITLHPSVTPHDVFKMMRDFKGIKGVDGNNTQRFLVTCGEQGNMGFVKVPARKDQLGGLPSNPTMER